MKTWDNEEKEVIKSKDRVLSQVLSVEGDDRLKVNVILNMPEHLGYKREWHDIWTL